MSLPFPSDDKLVYIDSGGDQETLVDIITGQTVQYKEAQRALNWEQSEHPPLGILPPGIDINYVNVYSGVVKDIPIQLWIGDQGGVVMLLGTNGSDHR